jgi:predicted MFS family arabinose efflux permease
VAISLMLTAGLVAAFGGPQVFIIVKDAFAPVPLAGAYAAIAVISVIGLLPLALVRMPTTTPPTKQGFRDRLASLSVLQRGPVHKAVAIGAVSQGIMVFLMIPTPLAMVGCGFSEATSGDVFRWHVVAMFAPSFFTGFLIKRYGTQRIALGGLALLILSVLVALSGLSGGHFYVSLILLGLGWNFGFIGATNMLTRVVSEAERPVVQGANDTVIALASTICAFAAGAIVAGYGWTVLAVVALVVLVVALGALAIPARQAAV